MIQSSIRSTRYVTDGEVDPSIRALAERTLWVSHAVGPGIGGSGPVIDELDAWLFASRFGGFDSRIVDSMKGAGGAEWEPVVFVSRLKTNWPENRLAFEAMSLSADEIEALLFFRGDVENWNQTFQDEAAKGLVTEDDVRLLAKNIASSVPPLGKKWLKKFLVNDGVNEGDAAAQALEVYSSGSNLIAFERAYTRRKAVTALLRLRDPNVADEQIERVVMSPMSLEQIETSITGGRGGGPRSGGAAGASGGEGGGMGLLLVAAAVVGGAVLLGKKKR